MSQVVTSAPLLDNTGQQIVSKLESIRALIGAEVTPATTAVAGIVKPDGTTITVTNDGTISADVDVAVGTTSAAGIVKPDGTTITVDNTGTISVASRSAVDVTVSASGWSSRVYSFETLYPSSSYDILDILPNDSTTDAQRKAWVAADCAGYRSTNTIYAHGTVPTIDMVLTLIVSPK